MDGERETGRGESSRVVWEQLRGLLFSSHIASVAQCLRRAQGVTAFHLKCQQRVRATADNTVNTAC